MSSVALLSQCSIYKLIAITIVLRARCSFQTVFWQILVVRVDVGTGVSVWLRLLPVLSSQALEKKGRHCQSRSQTDSKFCCCHRIQ